MCSSTVMFGVGAVAVPQDDQPWVSPESLFESLDQLEELPLVSVWAGETRRLIEATIDGQLTSAQRSQRIDDLIQQYRVIQQLNQTVWHSDLPDQQRQSISSQLLAFRHQLTRRVATWPQLVKLDQVPLEDDPVQEQHVQHVDFSSVKSTWTDYLLLQEFSDVFTRPDATDKQKRKTARRVLSRIYSPILQPDQSKYVRSIFPPDVTQFLKSHASRPVDASKIAARLERYEQQPSARSGYYINDVLQDLIWSDDKDYLAAARAIEAHYRNANFRLTVSQEFMNRLLPELPTIASPVSETIGGAQVSGSSQVSNELNVMLVPDENRLNFQIQTNGHVQSDTVARTKAFRILNQGHANFLVTKQISVTRDGFDTSQQAYAASTAKQFLVDVQSKVDNVPLFGYLARRAAEKRVREQTPKNTQLFRRRVAQDAEFRVEQELSNQVRKVEASASKKLLKPLVAMDLEPVPVQLATTQSQIVIRYRLAGRDQMAANTARPVGDANSLIEFQLHQSLVSNAIARLGLNGETFTGPELAKHLQDVLGIKTKPEMSTGGGDQEVVFKFAKVDPVRVDFKTDRINFVIGLASLKIGAAKPLRNLSLTASYRVDSLGMQVQLNQDQTGTRVTGKNLRLGGRAKISTVMKLLFEETYSFNALPKKFRDSPQSQSLAISRLVVNDGWLGVSLRDVQVAVGPKLANTQRLGENVRRMFDRR